MVNYRLRNLKKKLSSFELVYVHKKYILAMVVEELSTYIYQYCFSICHESALFPSMYIMLHLCRLSKNPP